MTLVNKVLAIRKRISDKDLEKIQNIIEKEISRRGLLRDDEIKVTRGMGYV